MTPDHSRAAVLALLEPSVQAVAGGLELTPQQMERLSAYSQAVSLRRIADALNPIHLIPTQEQVSCPHRWTYTGTDPAGSHKGEDHFICTLCRKTEYRQP